MKANLRPYIDYGKPGLRYQRGGALIVMQAEPEPVRIQRLALEVIKRHNSLEPELQPTHRVLLRWTENEGSGLPNPDADKRETHYDPLPMAVQSKVTEIVDSSPWARFIRKIYFSTVERGSLAEQLGISRTQFYSDRRSALWFCRGRFESECIYG
jgi:hypothetical protein